MFDGHGLGGGSMWLLWIVLIVVALLAVKAMGGYGAPRPPRSRTAREILEERYARGEIDRDEFDQKRRDLEQG